MGALLQIVKSTITVTLHALLEQFYVILLHRDLDGIVAVHFAILLPRAEPLPLRSLSLVQLDRFAPILDSLGRFVALLAIWPNRLLFEAIAVSIDVQVLLR